MVHKSSLLDRMIFVLFIIGLIPAVIPLFIYTDDHNPERLILLIIAMACLHVGLLIRSYTVVMATTHTALMVNEVVHIPTIWRLGVRRIVQWHLAFGLLRFGLAIGFSQMLHSSLINSCREYYLFPYCHWSCNLIGGINYEATYPMIQLLPALVNILLYSLLEAGLSSAAAVFVVSWMRSRYSSTIGLLFVVLLRVAVFTIALMVYLVSVHNVNVVHGAESNEYQYAGVMCGYVSDDTVTRIFAEPSGEETQQAYNTVLTDNLMIIPFVLIDNATLLTADLMRQHWDWLAVIQRLPAVIGGILVYMLVIQLFLRTALYNKVAENLRENQQA